MAAGSSSGPRSVPPSVARPGVAHSDGLQNFDVYDDVCHNVAHPDAPAYGGGGPHPLTYFYEDPNGGHNGLASSDPGTSPAPWDALDMTKVQRQGATAAGTGAKRSTSASPGGRCGSFDRPHDGGSGQG